MLPRECRNPQVICGYRAAVALELISNLRIVIGGFVIDLEDSVAQKRQSQPSVILRTLTRLPNAIAIRAQYDKGLVDLGDPAKDGFQGRSCMS